MAMAANWHPLMGFVTSCLFSGVTFASLSWQPIMEKDIINIGVHTINRTAEFFAKEYKKT
jgi:ABC-type uncharacterized transport system permease subunit